MCGKAGWAGLGPSWLLHICQRGASQPWVPLCWLGAPRHHGCETALLMLYVMSALYTFPGFLLLQTTTKLIPWSHYPLIHILMWPEAQRCTSFILLASLPLGWLPQRYPKCFRFFLLIKQSGSLSHWWEWLYSTLQSIKYNHYFTAKGIFCLFINVVNQY